MQAAAWLATPRCNVEVTLLVRSLDPSSDLPALQALWRAVWRDTYGPMLGPDRMHVIDEAVATPAVSRMFAADGGGFVAILDGDVVGSVCFAERHGYGYIWGMYVHPSHQSRGVGSALLRRAARAMGGATTLELSTVTPASEAFYRRLGFGAVGASDIELLPGVPCPSTVLNADAAGLRAAVTPPA